MIRNAVLAGSGSRSTAKVSYKTDILGKDFSDRKTQGATGEADAETGQRQANRSVRKQKTIGTITLLAQLLEIVRCRDGLCVGRDHFQRGWFGGHVLGVIF